MKFELIIRQLPDNLIKCRQLQLLIHFLKSISRAKTEIDEMKSAMKAALIKNYASG